MPIEVYKHFDGENKSRRVGIFDRASGYMFNDYNAAGGRAIFIRCIEDGSAGQVNIWEQPSQELKEMTTFSIPTGAESITVTADSPFEVRVHEEDGTGANIKVLYYRSIARVAGVMPPV